MGCEWAWEAGLCVEVFVFLALTLKLFISEKVGLEAIILFSTLQVARHRDKYNRIRDFIERYNASLWLLYEALTLLHELYMEFPKKSKEMPMLLQCPGLRQS